MTKTVRFPTDNLPAWIIGHPRQDYLAARFLGRPRDPADRRAVLAIYDEARRLRRRGHDVVVDHIEPLCSDWVCGLHHAANLRIVPRSDNLRKSNGADHPRLDLEHPVHQCRLL